MTTEALELARQISHKIWGKYDDTYGYRTEKQEANAHYSSAHPDNIWSFWGQFDSANHLEFGQLAAIALHDKMPGSKELGDFVEVELERERKSINDLADMGIFL